MIDQVAKTILAALLIVGFPMLIIVVAKGLERAWRRLPTELEMHRADFAACKTAGFESPGELLSAHRTLLVRAHGLEREREMLAKLGG